MIRFILLAGALALMAEKTIAQNDGCCDCPECGRKVCTGKVEMKKVKKTLFSVEKKDICIPKIRFPWQIRRDNCGTQCDSSCDANGNCGICQPLCGRVKTVKVLKKRSIECDKCGYKWEITTVESTPCCNSGSLRRGRGNTACDSALDYHKK